MSSRFFFSLLMGLVVGATPPASTAPAMSPHHTLKVTLDAHHTCQHTASASTRCWGNNASGQLGPSTALTVPVHALAGGETHTCAAPLGGGAWCWGGNLYGQLGDGTHPTSHRPPAPVLSLTVPLSGLVAGAWHNLRGQHSGPHLVLGAQFRRPVGCG